MWDIFLSHADEEKRSIAQPLASALRSGGFTVWFDADQIELGASLSEAVDGGLARSRYAVVILSRSYFESPWTRRELQGLVARELAGELTILPVWHELALSEVRRFSPPLADRLAVSTLSGVDRVASRIIATITTADAAQQPRATADLTSPVAA